MKVSVIVPIYNVELYLQQCVDSIRNQTMEDVEIILVDDGSPDNCPQMCDRFAAEDSRIRVVHQDNMGVSVARNRGIELATGDWLMFVDPDDWLELNALEVLYNKAVSGDYEIVCATFYKNFQNDQTVEVLDDGEEGEHLLEEDQEPFLGRAIRNIHLNGLCWKLYKKDMLIQNKCFFPVGITHGEDNLFMLYVYRTTRKIYVLDVPVYHYRQRAESAIRTLQLNDLCRFYAEVYQFMEQFHLLNEFRYYYYRAAVFGIFRVIRLYRTDIKVWADFHNAARGLRQFCSGTGPAEAIRSVSIKQMHSLKDKILFWLVKQKMYFLEIFLYYIHDQFIKQKSTVKEELVLYP